MPTSACPHQSAILSLLRQQSRAGRAVVVVLHDLNLASAFADDILLMRGGRTVRYGPARNVLTDDALSEAYSCPVRTNAVPTDGRPYIIPGL